MKRTRVGLLLLASALAGMLSAIHERRDLLHLLGQNEARPYVCVASSPKRPLGLPSEVDDWKQRVEALTLKKTASALRQGMLHSARKRCQEISKEMAQGEIVELLERCNAYLSLASRIIPLEGKKGRPLFSSVYGETSDDVVSLSSFLFHGQWREFMDFLRQKEEKGIPIVDRIQERGAKNLYAAYLYSLSVQQPEKSEKMAALLKREFGDTRTAAEFLQIREEMKHAVMAQAKRKPADPPVQAKTEEKKESEPKKESVPENPRPEPAKPAVEEKKESEEDPEIAGLNEESRRTLKTAKQYHQNGYMHLKKSLPGMKDADNELGLAKKDFAKALQYYQKAMALNPGNSYIEAQLQEVNEYYHHCVKQTRLK